MHWQILGSTVNTRAAALVGKHQQTSPVCLGARLPVGAQGTSRQGKPQRQPRPRRSLTRRRSGELLFRTCSLLINPAFVSLLGESQLTQHCKRDHGVFNRLNDCVITSLPKRSSTIRAHQVLTT